MHADGGVYGSKKVTMGVGFDGGGGVSSWLAGI